MKVRYVNITRHKHPATATLLVSTLSGSPPEVAHRHQACILYGQHRAGIVVEEVYEVHRHALHMYGRMCRWWWVGNVRAGVLYWVRPRAANVCLGILSDILLVCLELHVLAAAARAATDAWHLVSTCADQLQGVYWQHHTQQQCSPACL